MEELITSFGLDGKLLLMQIINFSILLFLLWRFLYKPIFAILDKRQRTIEQGILDAQDAKQKLADADDEGKEIIANASSKADGIIATSKKAGEQKKAEIIDEAVERADNIVLSAQKQAEELKKTALEESKAELARTAVLAAEKILRQKLAK